MERIIKTSLFSILLVCFVTSFAQKPALTLGSYKNWSQVQSGGLSPDGHYAFYFIGNIFYESSDFFFQKRTFYLTTTSGKDILSITGLNNPKFSSNSHYLYGSLPGDSLLIYDLVKNRNFYINGVTNYELRNVAGTEYLIVKVGSDLKRCELSGKMLTVYKDISQSKFSPNGNTVLFVKQGGPTGSEHSIWWVDVLTGQQKQIYSGTAVHSIIFDNDGLQVAFMTNSNETNRIFYYKPTMDKAMLLVDNGAKDIANNLIIETGDYWAFSADGQRIFFSLKEPQKRKREDEPEGLEIWGYQDAYLRSFYHSKSPNNNNTQANQYLATVSIDNARITQLVKANEKAIFSTLRNGNDDNFIIEYSDGWDGAGWTYARDRKYFLCNAKTGERTMLESEPEKRIVRWHISPTGRYLLYFNRGIDTYVCYDIPNKKKTTLSTKVLQSLTRFDLLNHPKEAQELSGVCGWLPDDQGIILNSSYDIWRIDPKGIASPINLTKGLGSKNKIVFCLLGGNTGNLIGSDNTLILSGFDTRTKDFGFFSCSVNRGTPLKQLSMSPRYIGNLNNGYLLPSDEDIQHSNTGFLFRFENYDQAPNYFYSRDLRKFTAISKNQPQSNYNWLTAELHTYKDSAGNELQGILYKPENFDDGKQYPVIFNIYQMQSSMLNKFQQDLLQNGEVSIPLMVSNGYLVFLPDIRGRVGASGDAALKCVLAAMDHLKQFSWADQSKMALVGHSVGGFETNYILTHTDRFAAGISGAGISSMIRAATDLYGTGDDKQYFVKYSAYMMENDLNDAVDAYVRNSPILSAKNLTAPLLLLHNDNDASVDYHHTQSFFVLLRNLQKRVWWLNYKGHGHGVGGEKNQLDYNTRTWQFLDHYLKGKPMPQWMKEHI